MDHDTMYAALNRCHRVSDMLVTLHDHEIAATRETTLRTIADLVFAHPSSAMAPFAVAHPVVSSVALCNVGTDHPRKAFKLSAALAARTMFHGVNRFDRGQMWIAILVHKLAHKASEMQVAAFMVATADMATTPITCGFHTTLCSIARARYPRADCGDWRVTCDQRYSCPRQHALVESSAEPIQEPSETEMWYRLLWSGCSDATIREVMATRFAVSTRGMPLHLEFAAVDVRSLHAISTFSERARDRWHAWAYARLGAAPVFYPVPPADYRLVGSFAAITMTRRASDMIIVRSDELRAQEARARHVHKMWLWALDLCMSGALLVTGLHALHRNYM